MTSKNESLFELAVRIESLRRELADMDRLKKDLREAEAELLAQLSPGGASAERGEEDKSGVSALVLKALGPGDTMTVGDLVSATMRIAPGIRQALIGLVKRGLVRRVARGAYAIVRQEP